MNSTAPAPSEQVFLFPRRNNSKIKQKVAAAATILVILSQGAVGWLNFGSPVAHAAPAEGSLVRVASNSAVYYVGRDGKRYVFPNEATYFSWYHSFDGVQFIDDATLASMPIGPLITVRPNIRFVRFDSEPRVYAVEPGGFLRWVPDEATFQRLGFRLDQVITIPDVFQPSYTFGPALAGPAESAVVQVGDGGPMYYIRNGQRHPITSAVAQLNRYFPNHVRHVSQATADAFTDGAAITGFDRSVAGRPDDRVGSNGTETPPAPAPTSTAPAAPTNFAATGGAQQAQLNWQRSASGAVVNYVVYRSFLPITNLDASGVTIVATPPPSASNLNVTGLAPGTRYYFGIRAAGPSGTFSSLATANATTLDANAQVPPSPPTSFVATGGNLQVQLSWVLSGTSGVTNYVLYRSTSFFNQVDAPGVAVVATTSASAVSYTNAGLASSTTYFFGVRARGGNGLYSALVTASATTNGSGSQPTPPSPPTSFAATASQQDIQLSWVAPPSPNIATYQLYRASSPISDPAAPGVTAVATVSAPAVTYADLNLAANTTYHYAVRATNASGLSSSLAAASATTGISDPNAPRALATAAGSQTVELAWLPPTNAGFPVNYQVYRSSSPITPSQLGTLVTTGNSSAWTTEETASNLVDVLLAPNTTYYYAVRAVGSGGALSSLATAGPVTTAAAPAAVPMAGHPRVELNGADVSGMRLRMVANGPVNENLLQTVNGQWSGGGYSRTDNLKSSLVDYSSLNPAAWTSNVTPATPADQILGSFTQWNNIVGRGSLVALLTDDSLARQRAVAGLQAVTSIYTNVMASWVPDGSYPDEQPRQEALKSAMYVVAVGYDRLYPWMTTAQRQQVASVARQLLEKYRTFWIPDGFWAFPETHTHEDNAVYLRSLMAFSADPDLLPADRQALDAAATAKLSEYYAYLQWLTPFLQDGSGGATAYWGYYAYGEGGRMLSTVETIANSANPGIYQQYPALRNIVAFQAYTDLPNDYYIHTGNGGYGIHYNIVPMTNLARRYGDQVAAWLASRFRTHSGANQNAYKEWGLQYDPTLPAQTPQQAGYGLDWFSSKAGLATMRSDWTDNAVVASIMNPPVARLQKLQQTAGNFTIYYRGPQAVKSGAYDVGNGSPHFVQYDRKTISANTLTITDPAEVFCDSRYHPAESPCDESLSWNDGGQPYRRQSTAPADFTAPDRQMGPTVYDSQPGYSYTRADLTKAYWRYADAGYSTFVSKASEVVREFVYLRPKTFVVLDRVTAANANFAKRWLLHTESEPSVSGSQLSNQVPGHISEYNGDAVTVAASGQGRLFAKLLLPASRRVKKVGGAGYEFYADTGVNYPAVVCNPPDQAVCDGKGKWRLEVSPAVASASDVFLNVLHVDDAGVSAMPSATLVASTTNAYVANVAGTAVVFGATSAAQSSATYSDTGLTQHLFVDLVPNASYQMTVTNLAPSGDVSTQQFSASAQGTALVATATPGSYVFSIQRQ